MKKAYVLGIIILLAVVPLAGCTMPFNGQPTEEEYLQTALGYFSSVAEITQEYAEDAEAFFNQELSGEEFSTNIEDRQSKLKDIQQEMENLTPPNTLEEFHELTLKGMGDIDQSFDLMLEFLDSPSEDRLISSLEQFEEGIMALNEAGESIEHLLA